MDNDHTKGVIYCAYGKQHFEYAVFSAESLKKNNPNISITIFTDDDYKNSVFDNIIVLPEIQEFASTYNNESHTSIKLICFKHSPYERTLYLDNDTFVRGDISEVYNFLDEYDFVITRERDFNPITQKIISFEKKFYVWVGVILFNKTEPMARLFDFWKNEFDRLNLNNSSIWGKVDCMEFCRSKGVIKNIFKLCLKFILRCVGIYRPTEQNILNFELLKKRKFEKLQIKVGLIPSVIWNASMFSYYKIKKEGLWNKNKIITGRLAYDHVKEVGEDGLPGLTEDYYSEPGIVNNFINFIFHVLCKITGYD